MNLEVTYKNSTPERIRYSSRVYGAVKFHMEGSTAVIDGEWGGLNYNLTESCKQKVRDDVIEAVEDLPFVQAVEA
jgi:hypothetical protein